MAADANSAGDWAAALQKAQADLLRQWTDMSQAWTRVATGAAGAAASGATAGSATGSGAAPGSPGAGGAETGGAGHAAAGLARGFLQQCEQYLGVSRSLWELVGRSATIADPEQRTRTFTEGLAGLQQQFAGLWAATPFGAPAAGLAAGPAGLLGPLGMTGWPGAGQAGLGFPGTGGFPGMNAMPGMGGFPGIGAGFAWPAVGPTRERQDSWQRLVQLATRCGQAQLQVSAQWNDIIGKALRELGERLAPRLKSGAAPGSMKEIYDLWVDSAESVYAQAARGAAFVKAQAELTNAISQLRTAQRELLEEWAKQFDLPTRSELNSIHSQLRELKAAMAAARG